MARWLIVGAGAAGCVVASRLSDDPSEHVTVVEAGPDHGARPDERDVGPFLDDPARVRTDAVLVRRPGTGPVRYEQGFGLGGSSLINGSVAVPDPAGAVPETRLPLVPPWTLGTVGQAVLDACADARPVLLARNGRRRVTVADAYLRPVLDRPNLDVRVDTAVTRLLVDGRRIVGVSTADGTELTADRVVVCGGAIQTPTLLLRSGIDTPGVGERLQDHPAFTVAVDLVAAAVDPDAPSIAVTVERPGRQIVTMNHLAGAPAMGALVAALTDVTSEGRISVPDPDGPPRVELHQLANDRDRNALADVALEALALLDRPSVRRIVARAHLDDIGTPVSRIMGDRSAVGDWLIEHPAGLHHVAGSCRLGEVTDGEGHVRGYDGLSVCDASLLPGPPRLNPYLSVIVLAQQLADRWYRGGVPR